MEHCQNCDKPCESKFCSEECYKEYNEELPGENKYYDEPPEFDVAGGLLMYFGNITIQSKDDHEDFRAFCHCESEGQWWELRGYGKTPGQAADDAWQKFQAGPELWEFYGYPTDQPKD